MTMISRILAPLTEKAALSPTAQAAFCWLNSQDIEIVFDQTLRDRGVLALYNCRAARKWISLSPTFKNNTVEQRIGTLVHEIRHAWQDANGLLLRNDLRFNLRYGMAQAFIWLCTAEADAYAQSLGAVREVQGYAQTAGDFQHAYLAWFHSRLPHYLDRFVAQWNGILDSIDVNTGRDPQYVRAFLSCYHETKYFPVDVASLRAMGRSFAGVDDLQSQDFYQMVERMLLPGAIENYAAQGQAALVHIDRRLADLQVLATDSDVAPVRKQRGAGWLR